MTTVNDDYLWQAAIVMASLELLPAQPSDLTHILRDPVQCQALLDPGMDSPGSELVQYLRESLVQSRIAYWHKQVENLLRQDVARPILAADLPGTAVYPPRLAECWDAPPILFASAEMVGNSPSAAIIGSRAASPDIVRDTHDLATILAISGTTIVSGLALGVDTAAHEGALAVGGITVAVMGTGITRIYPEQNTELAYRIRKNGVLLSQFAPYAPRARTSFLRRNHVIAGLSDVSIIMSGQSRSGSRHEIERAVGYGRPVLMWSHALEHQDWARKLADAGKATFVASAEDVQRAIDWIDL